MVFTVVLTGGPCGGKSSALPLLKKSLTDQGYRVYTCQESMSLLRSGGCQMTHKHGEAAFDKFLDSCLGLQIQMEQSFAAIADSIPGDSVLILDRGILDLKISFKKNHGMRSLDLVGLLRVTSIPGTT